MTINPRRDDPVLIVGAGLAGLSLAIALRQRGFVPAVIERGAREATAGAGLYLVGAATRALAALGLGDAVQVSGIASRTQTFYSDRGRLLAQIEAAAFWMPSGPCLGIARAALHRLLAEKVADLPIRYGTSVVSLRQHDDGVTVECTDGSRSRYALVVGADGIRSTVRRLILNRAEAQYRGQLGWRFLARRPGGIDGWTVYLGADRAFLLVPVSADQVYCYADRMAERPTADPPEGRIERLRALFRDFAEPVAEVLRALETAEHVHFAAIEEVVLEQCGKGRAVLIGDAAHAMSPNMPCGAAMAFEDALVLSELVCRLGLTSAVLPEFEQRRSARVRWVRAQTNRRDRLRSLPTFVRNALLRCASERIYRANYAPLLADPRV
jgi:2-polyprenyl-6-methoxyphenol hydroxylase-like FAD-dependent oxidoreductase